MKKIVSLICGLLLPFLALAGGVINTTSLQTIGQSLQGEKPADLALIGEFAVQANEGLDANDPKSQAVLLQRLSAKFKGKTVAQVAAELRAAHKAQNDQQLAFANKYVYDCQAKWKQRAAYMPSIIAGVRQEDLLKALGAPDTKTSSKDQTTWFFVYHYKATLKAGFVYIDSTIVELSGGKIVKVVPLTETKRPEELMSAAAATATVVAPTTLAAPAAATPAPAATKKVK
jgi:hypothetical protein